jgi:hypothetical protein
MKMTMSRSLIPKGRTNSIIKPSSAKHSPVSTTKKKRNISSIGSSITSHLSSILARLKSMEQISMKSWAADELLTLIWMR